MLEEILKIRKTDAARLSDTSDASSATGAQENRRDSADDHESSDKSGGIDSSRGGRGSKIIIFSKWPEVLQRISAALKLNGIACAYPSGKRQDGSQPNDPNAELDHFKTSEQTFVLLLLVDEGAVRTNTPSY
eukprot:COSAG02_NODE_264_length_26618_cov_244.096459_10_plen_132_part_00